MANLIGIETQVRIAAAERIAIFTSHKKPSLVREDRSIRDLDAIGFSRFPDTYQEARRLLREETVKARGLDLPYPPISIEPTHYPNWPRRNRWFQFVSTIDADSNGGLHLTFGSIDQPTPQRTFEPWTIRFDGGLTLTSINPYGLPWRYWMRNASGLKKKDQVPEVVQNGIPYSKLDMLTIIARSVLEQSLTQGEDYMKLYETWDQFIDTLLNHPDHLTKAKALITRVYWETVGTAFAHGRGILKPFANMGDWFTG